MASVSDDARSNQRQQQQSRDTDRPRQQQQEMSPRVASSRVRKYQRRNKRMLNNYVTYRKWMPYINLDVINMARNHGPFLNRLNFMKALPVHDGCVNTICWNKTGEHILSGSDDSNLCITKPNYLFDSSKDYTVLHKIPTRHLGNIFCARYMPNSGDSLIASCSSEGTILVHDINSPEPHESILNYNCHGSTVYETVPIPDDDKVFLSCSEDKTIRLFDLRVHASCARAGTCPHPALIRNSSAMTTLDLHPLNSNLMLVGRADGLGLVYDRRMLPDVTKFSREKAHAERLAGSNRLAQQFSKYMHPLEGVVSQFTVPDMEEKCRFTSLCYNGNGSEVLASFSGDYVYLFNHSKSSDIELIQTLPKKSTNTTTSTSTTTTSTTATSNSSTTTSSSSSSSSSSSTNNNSDTTAAGGQRGARDQNRSSSDRLASGRPLSGINRIRVRGDWSDTGINSVPYSRSSSRRSNNESNDDNNNSSNQNQRNQASNFWQHMADVAYSLSSRRTGEIARFLYSTASNNTNNNNSSRREQQDQSQEQQQQQPQESIEEEDEDDNSTVVDDEEMDNISDEEEEDDNDDDEEEEDEEDNVSEDDEDDKFQRRYLPRRQNPGREDELSELADATTKRLVDEATEQVGNRTRDESARQARSRVSAQTRMKFRKTVDHLKNKYNNIVTHHPRVKYQGHRNNRTSIKEAKFWGDKYIMSGSDCGRIMIWEKETANIVLGFPADNRVVNCLAPNPHSYCLASSGIDYDIKLWSTQSIHEGPLKVSDKEMDDIVANNEEMIEESKQTISVPPHLFFRVLASLAHMSNNNNPGRG